MAKQPKTSTNQSQDDAFIARILQLTVWAKQNTRVVVIGAVALAIVVLGGIYYVNFQNSVQEQAVARLTEVRQTVSANNPALAIRDLETFVQQYGSTPAGKEGQVLLGRLYLEDGQPERAIEAVRDLARNPGEPLGVPAAKLLAAGYEATDSPERAEEAYLRIADEAELGYQRREALDNAARVRIERNDVAGAVELYERLMSVTPDDSPERGLYEVRLAEARAMAETGVGADG